MGDELLKILEELESEKIKMMAEVKEGFDSLKRKLSTKRDQAYRGLKMGDELLKIFVEELESEKIKMMAEVKEGFDSLKRKLSTIITKRNFKDETTMKLEFRNGIAPTIKTGEEIKGEGGVPMEVALVDGVAGAVVEDEPESSAKIELVLLKGSSGSSEGDNSTHEEFTSSIVPQVEGGKLPILSGNVALQLKRGVGTVNGVKIRNHAIKIKPPKFKLGARVVGASRVKEAKTKTFDLKDYRVKYKEKQEIPFLSDEVWKLALIGKGGEIHKRLQESNINTVEDFLIQLLINPQGLRAIAKAQAKKWKATVENARACLGGERVYCYVDPEDNRGVVFNILGRILGTCSGSFYSHTSMLSEEQKADAEKLLTSACKKWEEVKAFNDENTLQKHLAGLSTRVKPDFPSSGASEMVGESSSFPSFHSATSTMDLFGSFPIDVSDDIQVMYDAVMQCNHAWPCSPSLFEGLEFESNAYEEIAAAAVNRTSNSPKIWKKLLCVAKWLSVRKKVALGFSSSN